jgi:hypothetical protein
MKEKRKRTPAIPLGIIIVDDPLYVTDNLENRKKLNTWLYETLSTRLKSNDESPIILHSRVYESNIYPLKTNEDMRTSPPKKTSLRLELEAFVYAWNTTLKEAVKTMDIIILLRNAHPAYRSTFASKAFEIGLISDRQRSEFVIGPVPREYSRTNWAP